MSVPCPRWSEEELAELQDPWLAAEAESLAMWSDELYDEACRLPPPPGCEGCVVPTKYEFVWALDMLQSRTIRIDRDDGGWKGTPLENPSGGGGATEDGEWVGEGSGTIRALVPWLDMLNHSPESNNFFSLQQVVESNRSCSESLLACSSPVIAHDPGRGC